MILLIYFKILICLAYSDESNDFQNFDCRLFERETKLEKIISDSNIQKYLSEVINNEDTTSIKFLYFRYIQGREGYVSAFFISHSKSQTKIVDLTVDSTVSLSLSQKTRLLDLISDIENGSYKQACLEPGTGGSVAGAILNKYGELFFEYESQQYDYQFLNKGEKEKIKNAIKIFEFLDDL